MLFSHRNGYLAKARPQNLPDTAKEVYYPRTNVTIAARYLWWWRWWQWYERKHGWQYELAWFILYTIRYTHNRQRRPFAILFTSLL